MKSEINDQLYQNITSKKSRKSADTLFEIGMDELANSFQPEKDGNKGSMSGSKNTNSQLIKGKLIS